MNAGSESTMSTFKKPSIGLADERVDEAVTCQLFAGEQSKVSSEVYYRGPLRALCTKITCVTGDLRPVTVLYRHLVHKLLCQMLNLQITLIHFKGILRQILLNSSKSCKKDSTWAHQWPTI